MSRDENTLDRYASLELVAKPPIYVEQQPDGIDMSTTWRDDFPSLFEMPLGKHASVTLDGEPIPRGERRETIQDWMDCRLEEGDHLACWTMDVNGWNALYPTDEEIRSMRKDIDARERRLVEDNDATLFKDFTTPHVELKKVLAISFIQAKSYYLNLMSVKKDLPENKLVNWIEDIIVRRENFKSSDRIAYISTYKKFIGDLKTTREGSNEEMLALVKFSKVVQELLDPSKVLGMLNIVPRGFDGAFQHAIRRDLDDNYLTRDIKLAHHFSKPMQLDAFQLAFETVSGMELARGMEDVILDAERHNPIDTVKKGKTRSIIVERWLDKSPRLRRWNAPEDAWEGYSVSNPRVPRNETFASKDAFVTMFVRDEGWVKERKKMEERR